MYKLRTIARAYFSVLRMDSKEDRTNRKGDIYKDFSDETIQVDDRRTCYFHGLGSGDISK